APLLFLLQGFDIAVDVRDALLYFGIMTLAQVAEQRTPHWHVLAAVRGQFCIASEDAGHMQGGILSAVLLSQRGQVGGWDLQGRLCGSVAGGIGSVINSTIAGVHLLTGSFIRRFNRNVLT